MRPFAGGVFAEAPDFAHANSSLTRSRIDFSVMRA
jgi:hypothetical protein